MDFWNLIKGGGPVAVILLFVSLYAAFVFFYRLQVLRHAAGSLSKVLEQIRVDLLAGSVRSAIADARRSDTPAARVVVAGLERVQLGPDAVQAALNQATLLEEERIGRGLATLYHRSDCTDAGIAGHGLWHDSDLQCLLEHRATHTDTIGWRHQRSACDYRNWSDRGGPRALGSQHACPSI
jgi:hypothetical protein